MTSPTAEVEQRTCGCCGRPRLALEVAELGATPGVYICAGCALWAARRAGVFSFLRHVRIRPRLRRPRRPESAARVAIPILPSTDLGRTAAFYARVGFAEVERHAGYLLLENHGVELHFAQQDQATPSTCFLHVGDALSLWKELREHDVEGVGPIADQDYGLREFVLTDPDGNQLRVGSPSH